MSILSPSPGIFQEGLGTGREGPRSGRKDSGTAAASLRRLSVLPAGFSAFPHRIFRFSAQKKADIEFSFLRHPPLNYLIHWTDFLSLFCFLTYLLFSSSVLLSSLTFLILLPAGSSVFHSPYFLVIQSMEKCLLLQVPVCSDLICFRIPSVPAFHLLLRETKINSPAVSPFPFYFLSILFLIFSSLFSFDVLSIVSPCCFVNTFYNIFIFYLSLKS